MRDLNYSLLIFMANAHPNKMQIIANICCMYLDVSVVVDVVTDLFCIVEVHFTRLVEVQTLLQTCKRCFTCLVLKPLLDTFLS